MSDAALLLRNLDERRNPHLLLERMVGGQADDWQKELLDLQPGDTACVLASRRIGKSTSVGVMCALELGKSSVDDPHIVIIISPSLPQSMLLFQKIMQAWRMIGLDIGIERQTLTELHLDNGGKIICAPAGADGQSARGYGIRKGILAYDEAVFIPDQVFKATFAIAEDDAKIVLISTPGGKTGRFYSMWSDHEAFSEVKRIRACALDYPRMSRIVARLRKTMTPHEFNVEFGLEFMGSGSQFFDNTSLEKAFDDTPPFQLQGNPYAGLESIPS